MSDCIPNHIVDRILQKLPVREVLVSKAVCKRWNELITHPNFAQSQFESQTRPTRSLLLAVSTEIPHLESLELDRLPFGDRSSAVKFTSPFTRPNVNTDVILLGSCNGLVCACLREEFDPFNYVEELVYLHCFHIWNPSTGVSQRLDSPSFPTVDYFLHFHGFGYVSASQDYKLILNVSYFVEDNWESSRLQAQLFSVKEGKWKIVETHSAGVLECQGVNVNEKLHWVLDGYARVRDAEYLPLVAFDLEREEFQRMRLPNLDVQAYDGWGGNFSIALLCFEGLLCLWHYGKETSSGSVEFWVMETYEDSESWNMRYNFQISPESPISFLKPLVVTGSSQVFVRCSMDSELELVRIGPQQEEEERVLYMNEWRMNIPGIAHECAMILYDHTLLWHELLGAAGNQGPGQGQEGRPTKRQRTEEELLLLYAFQE